MRRPWIKIEVSTPDKPEICAIATKLRIDPDAVVGKLVRLWSWAELSGIQPNDLNVTKEFLDKVCGRKGFAEALVQAGWLLESDGKLAFPNFDRHNGNASKVRGLTARRVEQHRIRQANPNVKSVTKKPKTKPILAPIEVTEEENNNDVESVIITQATSATVAEVPNLAISPPPQNFTSEPLVEPSTPDTTPEPPFMPAEEFEVIEEKPKKKRGKASNLDEEQPLLF